MSKPEKFTAREHKWASVFGGALAVVGLLYALHGGLSLMGLYGLERMEIEAAGGQPPTRIRMWVELLAGSAVMLGGLAIRLKLLSIGQAPDPNDQQDVADKGDGSDG